MSAAFQLPVLNFQAPEICAACGGACCRRAPGIAHPEDFGAPDRADLRRRVEAALASGRWAVDWWEGDPRPAPHRRRLPRALFVRPARAGFEGSIFDPAWVGSACTFLGEDGCALAHDDRPHECRSLEPVAVAAMVRTVAAECRGHGLDKRALAEAWIPYLREIRSAARAAARTCRA